MASAQRIHVVVLFGGQSAEHDVSCVTAAHVIKALDSSKYDITAVGITREGKWVVAQPQADVLVAEGEPTSITPIVEQARGDARTVIFPLLHGPLGEDGTIQGVLELANIAYVGTGVLGSAVAMDKGVAKQVLHANGIPRSAVQHALTYDEWVLIEEAVVGREIEVAVLGNVHARASIPGEIIPGNEFYDYADKYIGDGAQLIVPANLTADEVEAVQHLAIVIFHTLRAEGMARVDFFYEQHGRGFLCNEINTIPGFTPISMYPKLWQASGMSYPALLDELIMLALDRFSRRRRNTAH